MDEKDLEDFLQTKRSTRRASKLPRVRIAMRSRRCERSLEKGVPSQYLPSRQSMAGLSRRRSAHRLLASKRRNIFVPAPIRICDGPVNGRWQAHGPGFGSRSRSFHLHGFHEGLKQLLQWAWAETLRRHRLPLSACPLKGFFFLMLCQLLLQGAPRLAASRESSRCVHPLAAHQCAFSPCSQHWIAL